MQVQAQATAATFRPFTEKSNAKRALVRSFGIAKEATDNYLRTDEGGQWGFMMLDGKPYAESIIEAFNRGVAEAEAAAKADEPTATMNRQTGMFDEPAVDDTPEDDAPTSAAGFNVFAAMVTPPSAPAVAPTTVVRDGKIVDPNAPDESGNDAAYTTGDPCPLCGEHADNITESNPGVSMHCAGCTKTFSIATGREVRAGFKRDDVNRGYKIEKNRTSQNGKTRRSPGTLCAMVWDALDEIYKTRMPVAKDLDPLAEQHGWNRNNVSCEFYAWRKFMGIKGRHVTKA